MKKYLFIIISIHLIFSGYFLQINLYCQEIASNPNTNQLNGKVDIDVTVAPELFPVIQKLLSEGNTKYIEYSLVNWSINNQSNDTVQITLTSDIPEWTTPVISNIHLAPNENKKVVQNPFGKKLLTEDHSTIPTTIILTAKTPERTIYEETKNVKIRPADDMIWSMRYPYDMCELIAAWVTPNDQKVESILAEAKERMFDNNLSGYRGDVIAQLKAIFNTVRNHKVSYVDSQMSFGEVGTTQRVRLPSESLMQKSANCIDGAVLFASLFENIGLESVIVIIPWHAFVGVRTAPNSDEIWFIETTLVGRNILNSIVNLQTTFQAAIDAGAKNYMEAMQSDSKSVYIIDIKKARQEGIYPLW